MTRSELRRLYLHTEVEVDGIEYEAYYTADQDTIDIFTTIPATTPAFADERIVPLVAQHIIRSRHNDQP